jgi:hypothetical protein
LRKRPRLHPEYGEELYRITPETERALLPLVVLFLLAILVYRVLLSPGEKMSFLPALFLLFIFLLSQITTMNIHNGTFVYEEGVEARKPGFVPWGKKTKLLVPFDLMTGILDDLEDDFEFNPRSGKLKLTKREGMMLIGEEGCGHVPLHHLSRSERWDFRETVKAELGRKDYQELFIELSRPELPEELVKEINKLLETDPGNVAGRFLGISLSVFLAFVSLFFLAFSKVDLPYPEAYYLCFLIMFPYLIFGCWERKKRLEHQQNWARLYLILCLVRDAKEGTATIPESLKRYIPRLKRFLAGGKRNAKGIDFGKLTIELDRTVISSPVASGSEGG